jgi:hypothetical protein
MSYEAKTQNLNLPQWVSGNKPEMLDFNKAFQAIDTGVGAKQNKIAASGILKGNGSGGVSAAVAGTDYATVDMAIQTLTGTIDFNTVTDTGLYRIKGATSFVNGPPVSSFPFDGVSLVDTLLQVDNFRSSVIMQTIRYGTTCMSRSTQMYGDGKTWGTWGASTWTDKQNRITASGILKGNGSGGVSAAVAGVDYPKIVEIPLSGDVLSFNSAYAIVFRSYSTNNPVNCLFLTPMWASNNSAPSKLTCSGISFVIDGQYANSTCLFPCYESNSSGWVMKGTMTITRNTGNITFSGISGSGITKCIPSYPVWCSYTGSI